MATMPAVRRRSLTFERLCAALEEKMQYEQWAAIPGFAGYEVSDLGNVRRGAKLLKATPTHDGYLRVSFWTDKGARKVAVHALVATAFLGPRPDGHAIRHLNGNKADNRALNLSYGTQRENEADKATHGTKSQGEKHGAAKLTEAQVREIRARYVPRVTSLRALGNEFGISAKTVQQIVRREKWAHVA